MKTTYWILAAFLAVALIAQIVARESAGTCQLPALSTGAQR
ncbi:hypothetical protein [Pseudomonas chlororaphis]|nr:hypothetical protein [Pseudomonas chlororaphis]